MAALRLAIGSENNRLSAGAHHGSKSEMTGRNIQINRLQMKA